MDRRELIQAAALYLDSVSPAYPAGVSKELLSARYAQDFPHEQEWQRHGSATAELLFVLDEASAEDPFQGPAGELLVAAVIKGLKLELSRVAVIVLPRASRGAFSAEDLTKMATDAPELCLVLLGERAAAACVELCRRPLSRGQPQDCSVGGHRFSLLATHSLAQVLADRDRKREFWADLQLILPRLGKSKRNEL